MKINWQESDSFKHKSFKPNKNRFCKKNKLQNKQYGPHVYEQNSIHCKLCGHLDKSRLKRNYNGE